MYQLNPPYPVCHFCLRVDFLFRRSIHWSQWDIKIPEYNCISVSLSLYVHQDLLYIFRCSYVGCISVLLGLHLIVALLQLSFCSVLLCLLHSLGFQVYFVRYNIATPGLFFSFPFTFSLCVSFVLRWVSYPFSYPMSFD